MESLVPDDVPRARAFVIHGFRLSAEALWGQAGLDSIASGLPPETRRRTLDELLVAVAWIPVTDLMSWYEAVWEGPARRSDESFARFVHLSVDHGFARVRRDLVKRVTPTQFAERAPSLWRRQHTHGDLSIALHTNDVGAIVGSVTTLRGNPLVDTALSRRGLVEAWLRILTLTRVKAICDGYDLEGDALVARFSWL